MVEGFKVRCECSDVCIKCIGARNLIRKSLSMSSSHILSRSLGRSSDQMLSRMSLGKSSEHIPNKRRLDRSSYQIPNRLSLSRSCDRISRSERSSGSRRLDVR